MNPALQRHCAKHIYIVPHGLRELMSDISREVIRAQPENIYSFIADYLDAMMITRENARVAVRLIDEISEIASTVADLLNRTGLSRQVVDEIARVIQRYFREYLEKKKMVEQPEEYGEGWDEAEAFTHRILSEVNIDYEKLVEVSVVIQNAYRRFKERREREKLALFGMIDWRIAAASTIRLYRRTGVTRYEANRAATLIKAAYKGYYTRRVMKRIINAAIDDESTIEDTMETATIPALEDTGSVSTANIYDDTLTTGTTYDHDLDGKKQEHTEVSGSSGIQDEERVLIELKTDLPTPIEGTELGGEKMEAQIKEEMQKLIKEHEVTVGEHEDREDEMTDMHTPLNTQVIDEEASVAATITDNAFLGEE